MHFGVIWGSLVAPTSCTACFQLFASRPDCQERLYLGVFDDFIVRIEFTTTFVQGGINVRISQFWARWRITDWPHTMVWKLADIRFRSWMPGEACLGSFRRFNVRTGFATTNQLFRRALLCKMHFWGHLRGSLVILTQFSGSSYWFLATLDSRKRSCWENSVELSIRI